MTGSETLRIATWNINSARLRIDLIIKLIEQEKPDIICLQEIKSETSLFPSEILAAQGYEHQHVIGMKAYNGVAILSRRPIYPRAQPDWVGRADARHGWVHVPLVTGGFDLHNFYIPAGGDIPDPIENKKFDHKLRFIDAVAGWFSGDLSAEFSGGEVPGPGPAVLVGDLNTAPMETDVWSHRQMLKVISHTPIEVEKHIRMQESRDWVDAVRHFIPAEQKLYSWWSYRARDWAISDRGRRLDHIWVSSDLQKNLRAALILKAARSWEKPSDHVPVLIDLAW